MTPLLTVQVGDKTITYVLKFLCTYSTVSQIMLVFLLYNTILKGILYYLGEFGRVYKGIWTHTTVEKEKISDVVAVKTIKSMHACIYCICS